MQRRKPTLTVTLLLLMTGTYFLPVEKELFYFSAEAIWQGQIWRLLTGHFTHADLNHLAWNCLGLGILGVMIEHHSPRAWWAAVITGGMCVNLLLLSPISELVYYCGLSGVLHTLLVVLLWLEWRRKPSGLVILVAALALAKTTAEIHSGAALISETSWPPYAASHVAGLLGGAVLIGLKTMLLVRRKFVSGLMNRICLNLTP